MHTTKEFYEKIKTEIPNFKCEDLEDKEICLSNEQLEMLKKLLLAWYNDNMINEAEKLLKDILKQPDSQNGKVYEAMSFR